MPVSIIANSSAMYAQNSLSKQSAAVTQSTLRMSTGQRVLSAADDAAAMAIGTSLKIENSGLAAASINATSGTSMLQIADGALGQIADIMNRLSALAIQSSSGQYDDATRVLINGEFSNLMDEVDRVANSTSFNGVKILSGTPEYAIGSGAPLAADGVKGIRYDTNIVNSDESLRYSYDAATENLTLTRIDGATPVSQTLNLTPLLNAAVGAGLDLNGNQSLELGFSQLGVTLTLGAGFQRAVNIGNTATVTPGADMGVATATFTAATANVAPTVTTALTALAPTYNATTGALNLTMSASGAGGTVTLDAVPGISYKVGAGAQGASGAASGDLAGAATTVQVFADDGAGGTILLGTVDMTTVAATAAGTGTGSLSLDVGGGLLTLTGTGETTARHLTYKVGTGVLAGEDTIGVDLPAMTRHALGLDGIDITTQFNADAAVDALKSALTTLNQGRATVGAQQERLESVARNIGVISDNNEAARSAMIDVDVSKEITDLTTNSTLMQASIAMLSRANKIPDILLEMLRN